MANFDYSKLKGRITEKCGSQTTFASKVGLSERSVSLKLNGLRSFRQSEIEKILKVLDIPQEEIGVYFFNKKVQN